MQAANLTGVMQNSAKLSDTDFSRATMRCAKLGNYEMTRADFSGAVLSLSDLRGNLTEANLSHVDLSGADLSGANLTGAILTQANMIDASMAETEMTRVRMDGAIGPHGKRAGTRPRLAPRRQAWWQFWR